MPEPNAALQRDHLSRSGLDLTLHAQQPWDGEAPDVGVEDADGQAPRGQGHGEVHRDRGFADAALARGDGQDPGRGADRRLGGVLACLPARPGHDGRSLLGVHGRHLHVDRIHPVERPHVVDDVLLDLAPQRARGDRQGHVDDDVPTVDGDGSDHAQIDDGVAEFWVDDCPQAVTDLVLAGAQGRIARGRRRCGGWGHGENCTCVEGISDSCPPGCWPAPGAGNMGPFVAHRAPRVVGRQA